MRLSTQYPASKKCVALLTMLSFLVTAGIVLPQPAWSLTLSEEKELGNKLLPKIREYLPVLDDGEIVAYVQSVGNRIVQQVGVTPYDYQFFVIDQSVPNAFAIPGGYIFIYRGLIEMMATEGELASILSHELAHIQARHIHRRLEDSKFLSVATIAGILAGALIGMQGGNGAAAQALAMGSMAGAKSFELKYSRENEREADQLGLRFLVAAGYAPRDMASVMEKLNQGQWRSNSRIPSYLSTHPALTERVQYLRDLAARAEKGAAKKPPHAAGSEDFLLMQAALVAGYSDGEVAAERLQTISRQSKAAAVYGNGRLCLRQGKINEALPQLQEAARLASGSALALSSLGALYLEQGKLAESQKALRTALLLDPSVPVVHLRLAQVLQELGQKDEALEQLWRIESYIPLFPEIEYQLGVLLGQTNRVGLAHYYLGRYYEQRQDWKLALFHYEKAKAMLNDFPEKRNEVEQSLKEVEKRKKKAFWEAQRGE